MNSDKVIFNIICRTGIFIRVVAVVVGVYGGSVIGNSLAQARLEDGQVSRLFLLPLRKVSRNFAGPASLLTLGWSKLPSA